MKPAGPLEIEVKLRIPSPAAVRPLLEQAGFSNLTTDWTCQANSYRVVASAGTLNP